MHFGIQNILFIIVLAVAIFFFARSFGKIWRNIKLGRDVNHDWRHTASLRARSPIRRQQTTIATQRRGRPRS